MREMIERYLKHEQRMMRDTIRAYVDNEVTPFIRRNWQLEWDMKPEDRPSVELLEGVHRIGVRTLGVPEEFGGTPLDPKTEVQTYAMIAEEIARGDSGLADKLVQIWKISLLLRNIPSFLRTEPRGASDRWLPYDVPEAMMHTRAALNGDKWVLNGRKQRHSSARRTTCRTTSRARAHPDQAPGGGDAARRHGDQARRGADPAERSDPRRGRAPTTPKRSATWLKCSLPPRFSRSCSTRWSSTAETA